MSSESSAFELPGKVEHCLALLSRLYAQDGKRQLQEIIVNAQVRVHEEYSYDDWNGGTYGHALYLVTPAPLFLNLVVQKDVIEGQILKDLARVHNVQNEFFAAVFLEAEVEEDHDWRRDSGVLLQGKRVVTPESCTRIWGEKGFRVFLSHKSEVKAETAELKKELDFFGVSCFVAHEDIVPTRPWQDEIENALASMDAFVALMTKGFHGSDWTDQEVGFAFARGVPMIAVRLGTDPYGFIGKFQALTTTWSSAPLAIARTLITNESMRDAYTDALQRCPCFDVGNKLGEILPYLESLSGAQVDRMIDAYNGRCQLSGSYAFNGSKPDQYGLGLVAHLERLGYSGFRYSSEHGIGQIRRESEAFAAEG